MNKIKKSFVLLAVLLMSGCSMIPTHTVYKTQVIAPDDNMLRNCNIAPPPDTALYLQADAGGREKMLTDNIHQHITDAAVCNSRWGAMRQWKQQQEDLYNNSKGN